MKKSTYRKTIKIFDNRYGSCYIYYVKPGGMEGKHFHYGIEIVYTIDGNCQTHKKGKFYFYKSGQIHEMINDSSDELKIICLTIPRESKENTKFIN